MSYFDVDTILDKMRCFEKGELSLKEVVALCLAMSYEYGLFCFEKVIDEQFLAELCRQGSNDELLVIYVDYFQETSDAWKKLSVYLEQNESLRLDIFLIHHFYKMSDIEVYCDSEGRLITDSFLHDYYRNKERILLEHMDEYLQSLPPAEAAEIELLGL